MVEFVIVTFLQVSKDMISFFKDTLVKPTVPLETHLLLPVHLNITRTVEDGYSFTSFSTVDPKIY